MAHLSTAFLEQFAGNPYRKDVSYKKGEIISFPNKLIETCYIVVSGYTRIYSIDKQGDMVIQTFYSSGDIFPLAWVTGRQQSDLFMDAMSDCVIAKIPIKEVSKNIKDSALIANLMLHQMGEQFLVYRERVVSLSFKFGRERLAYRLLLLAYRFGEDLPDGSGIALPSFSQQDIGSTINMTRESTNRELNRFERAGILTTKKNRIILFNIARLRKEVGDENDHFYFDELN